MRPERGRGFPGSTQWQRWPGGQNQVSGLQANALPHGLVTGEKKLPQHSCVGLKKKKKKEREANRAGPQAQRATFILACFLPPPANHKPS